MTTYRITCRALTTLALASAIGVATAALAFAATTTTSWSRSASGDAAPDSGLVQIPVDFGMLSAAGADLASLRITRAGTTYPWRLLDAPQPAAADGWQPATRLQGGREANAAVAEFEVPERSARYDAAQLELDLPEQQGAEPFVATATIEGSPDQRTWYEFARGSVYSIDVQASGATSSTSSNMTIGFAPTEYRYLRVSVPGASDVTALSTRAAASASVERATAASAMRIQPTSPSPTTSTTESVLTFDAGSSRTPLDLVQLAIDQDVFERDYTVRTAANRDELETAQPTLSGLVYRSSPTLEGVPGAQTSIDLGPFFEHERYVQVRIANGDDAPLEGLDGELLIPAPVVLAQLDAGDERVRLTYGRSDRTAPTYEFARLPQPDDAQDAPRWTLSKAVPRTVEVNPGEQQRRWLVNAIVVALGLVVVALAVFVLRRSRR